ncbi:hypothetical protein HDU91_001228 [Kappamyces sp. JEL0680]|nr:hypothetical protein HDU91_001228 [Kappamyces sp. JEL0680]
MGADAYIKESSHGLSQKFIKKYVRGRGRYGATPHPKAARLEIVLQERANGVGFKKRTDDDPLEWVRVRLRERRKSFVANAEGTYTDKRNLRPIKSVFV